MEGTGTIRVTKHFSYVMSPGIVSIVYVGGSCYINMLYFFLILFIVTPNRSFLASGNSDNTPSKD
jgi:hypothetical protein